MDGIPVLPIQDGADLLQYVESYLNLGVYQSETYRSATGGEPPTGDPDTPTGDLNQDSLNKCVPVDHFRRGCVTAELVLLRELRSENSVVSRWIRGSKQDEIDEQTGEANDYWSSSKNRSVYQEQSVSPVANAGG